MEGRAQPRASARVVTPLHLRILRLVAAAERAYGAIELRLEGGTALAAYYLEHRLSEDLDFFGGPAMDARDFRAFVEARLPAEALYAVAHGPASQGFAEFYASDQPASVPPEERQTIRVQFGRSSPFQLESPVETQEGIRVASYRDVCAGKLHALCDRYEPRDFIDLHSILHRPSAAAPEIAERERRRRFSALVADLEASDPGLTEVQVGQALARGLDRPIISTFPLRLLVAVTEADVQRTIRLALEECARLAREGANWDTRA